MWLSMVGVKMEGIILKNIDLTNVSLLEEVKKVKEEDREFLEAVIEIYDSNSLEDLKNKQDHAIEELWDKMQSSLGLLEKAGISAEMVMSKYYKHEEKIKNRPR